MSITITDSDREAIAKDWAVVLKEAIYDEEARSNDYGAFSSREFDFIHRNASRKLRLEKDICAFGLIMGEVAQLRINHLQASDPEYWTDETVKDIPYYGSSECRIWYRTFLALFGYKTYNDYILADSMDFQAICVALNLLRQTKALAVYRHQRDW
jgi:hypothetical protein